MLRAHARMIIASKCLSTVRNFQWLWLANWLTAASFSRIIRLTQYYTALYYTRTVDNVSVRVHRARNITEIKNGDRARKIGLVLGLGCMRTVDNVRARARIITEIKNGDHAHVHSG